MLYVFFAKVHIKRVGINENHILVFLAHLIKMR